MKYLSLFLFFTFLFTGEMKAQYPFNYLKPNKENGWNIFSINQLIQNFLFQYDNETSLCLADKIQQKYTKKETSAWSNQTKLDIVTQLHVECYLDANPDLVLDQEYRLEADSLINQKKYAEALNNLLTLEEDSVATANDYNSIGWCFLLTKQYSKAIKYLKKGEKLDEVNLFIQGNLAHAYLLTNEEELAMRLYKKYKGQNINETISWESMVAHDFEKFKEAGISHPKFEEVLQVVSAK
ncbi:MAG: tetratricopeptide repeat protein [Bacteroidia bacterium]